MGLIVCPSDVVDAPIERVWALVASTEGIDHWVDATLVSAEPDGPVQAGQKLHLITRAIGFTFVVTIDVLEVDPVRHRLHLLVDLPFGVVNDENLTLAEAGSGRTLVRFG